MAKIGLKAVVDERFIKRFQGIASGAGSPEKSIANALKGKNSQASIQTGLRVGARTFSTAVQGLNMAITFLSTSKATLENLDQMTDKLIALARKATESTTTNQERQEADIEFKRLGSKFKKIVNNAKLAGRELLTLDGVSDILTTVGLDQEKSSAVADVIKKFKTPAADNALASGKATGETKIPPQAYSATAAITADYESIFDDQATVTTRPNAYKILGDLEAMKGQIKENLAAGENGIDIIKKNVDLVRAAGFAFLELSEQINTSEDADFVAQELRKRIKKEVPEALSQAENLESIVVAALTLNPEDFAN